MGVHDINEPGQTKAILGPYWPCEAQLQRLWAGLSKLFASFSHIIFRKNRNLGSYAALAFLIMVHTSSKPKSKPKNLFLLFFILLYFYIFYFLFYFYFILLFIRR